MSRLYFSCRGFRIYFAPFSEAISYPVGVSRKEFEDFVLGLGLCPCECFGESDLRYIINRRHDKIIEDCRKDVEKLVSFFDLPRNRSALLDSFGVQLTLFD